MTHRALSDLQFLQQFESLTIDPALWDHEAHIRMAWLYLHQFDSFEPALKKISTGIRKFDIEFATEIKYHQTITIAFATIIHQRMTEHEDTWIQFINNNPDLLQSKELLSVYYSNSLLYSAEARIRFIEPDKRNF